MMFLAIVVIGLAAGWAAQLVLGRDTANRTEAFVAGIVGSLVGGTLAGLLAGDGMRIRPSGLLGSIVGAILVLGIWGALRRGTSVTR
jgi:uncharacterized membrane protein YeaQ/YmgE (transglycosylase-associated protein family)